MNKKVGHEVTYSAPNKNNGHITANCDCGEKEAGFSREDAKHWLDIAHKMKKKSKKKDSVNHPTHYNTGKIEVIEFIEDQKLGFNLGNAVKYVSRAGKKNPEKTVEDLEKAIWYLRREVALVKGNQPRPNEMPQERA